MIRTVLSISIIIQCTIDVGSAVRGKPTDMSNTRHGSRYPLENRMCMVHISRTLHVQGP